LFRVSGETLVLTDVGAAYLSTQDDAYLLHHLEGQVAGVSELRTRLKDAPITELQALELLREMLGVSWETPAQAFVRLGWLENLGAAKRTSTGQWIAEGES
jgi:hypothetical protein